VGASAGFNALDGENTFIGYFAGANVLNGLGNTFLGQLTGNTMNNSTQNTIIGGYANGVDGMGGSVVIGYGATATGSNQLVIGGANGGVSQGFLGNGVTDPTPTNFTLNATGASGTDLPGANFTLAAGRSTGSALGGNIIFSTTTFGASGTTLNPLLQRMVITGSGNVGIGTTNPTSQLHTTGMVRHTGLATTPTLTGYELAAVNTTTGAVERFTGTLPGSLPAGVTGNTLYHNGLGWVTAPDIFADGGNVGIGTSAAAGQRLTIGAGTGTGILVTASSAVSSGIQVSHTGSGSAIRSVNSSTGLALEVEQNGTGEVASFRKSGQPVLVMNSLNNVGIGTNTPLQRLQVSGGNLFLEGQQASPTATGVGGGLRYGTTLNPDRWSVIWRT
jgi:hypothetical protein